MSAQFKQRSELLTIYRELYDHPGLFVDEAERADLLKQEQRLLSEAFQIAFIGRFSVGKSMLINRLFLGDDVLTVDLNPTTARLMYIRYGQQPALWLVKGESENLEQLPLAAPGSTVGDISAAIKQHTTHLGSVEGEEIGAYQLDWPDGHFLKDGVQLVDSIGTEDINDQFINATYTAIRQSDAVVMVLNMTQPLTESEKHFIREHIGSTGKKLFLVVNKADARSPEEQQEVLDDLQERFIDLYQSTQISAEERIFAVSAKDGIGLEELRERLLHFVADERLGEIVRSHQTGLIQRLEALILSCRQRLTELQTKKDGDESQLRSARNKLQELNVELSRQHDPIENIQEEMHDEIRFGVRDILEKGEQKLQDFRLRKLSIDNIISELSDFFLSEREKLSTKLQRNAQRLLRRRISLVAGINPESLEQLNDLNNKIFHQIFIGTSMALGVSAMIAGGGAVVGAAQIATATNIGIWSSWIAGQSGLNIFAGALAPWAFPAIGAGIIVTVAAKKIATQQKEKNYKEVLNEARKNLYLECQNLEREFCKKIDDYIEQSWEKVALNIERESKKLEQLIAQKDLGLIDTEISLLSNKEKRLEMIRKRLADLANMDIKKHK